MRPSSRTRLCAVLLASAHLAGCASIVNPRVTPVAEGGGLSLPDAERRADVVINELDANISEHGNFEFWSGAGLLGIGLGATALGAFGGSRDAILGTAALGAAVTAGRAYIPFQERKAIYEQGIAALQCGRIASRRTQPVASEGKDVAESFLTSSDQDLEGASVALQSAYSNPAAVVAGASADEAVTTRQDLRASIRRVLALLDMGESERARMLDAVTIGVVQTVNLQLLAQGPKLDSAMDALKSGFGEREKNLALAAKKMREDANAAFKASRASKNKSKVAATSASGLADAAVLQTEQIREQYRLASAEVRALPDLAARRQEIEAKMKAVPAGDKLEADGQTENEKRALQQERASLALFDSMRNRMNMEKHRMYGGLQAAEDKARRLSQEKADIDHAAQAVGEDGDETEAVVQAALNLAAAVEALTQSGVPAKCYEALIAD